MESFYCASFLLNPCSSANAHFLSFFVSDWRWRFNRLRCRRSMSAPYSLRAWSINSSQVDFNSKPRSWLVVNVSGKRKLQVEWKRSSTGRVTFNFCHSYLSHIYSKMTLCELSSRLRPSIVAGALFGMETRSSSWQVSFSLKHLTINLKAFVHSTLRVGHGAVTKVYRSRMDSGIDSIRSATNCISAMSASYLILKTIRESVPCDPWSYIKSRCRPAMLVLQIFPVVLVRTCKRLECSLLLTKSDENFSPGICKANISMMSTVGIRPASCTNIRFGY